MHSSSSRLNRRPRWARAIAYVALGALLGIVVLHPVTMIVYWLELHATHAVVTGSLDDFIASRMAATISGEMAGMTALFAGIGAAIGLVFLAVDRALGRREEAIRDLKAEMALDIPSLIAAREGERLELKSTARWDLRQEKVNRALSDVIAKTVAGLANHLGGSLLIGVADDGSIVGLEQDYATLKQKDRDGFEQFAMTLVAERLGGDVCAHVRIVFAAIDGQDVCRVVVSPAPRPVYFRDGKTSRYFLRTGNATRELDVEAALARVRGNDSRTQRSRA